MIIQPDSRLLLIGDSVTDCQRVRTADDGSSEALGEGYVSLVDALLRTRYASCGITVFNRGVSGDTVRNLEVRWQRDVLDLRPDWLSICIGINDVWRQFVTGYEDEPPISLAEYETTLDNLIRMAKPGLRGLVLMTPYYIQLDRADPMRVMMDRFGAAVRRLAQTHQAYLVDSQAAFDALIPDLEPLSLAWDLVHLTHLGNMALARAWLQAVDFDWV